MSWEKVRLGDVMDLQNGYAFNSEDYVDNSEVYNCRMSNIRPGGIFDIDYNPRFLPNDYAEKYSQFLLKNGDIIVAMTDLANDPKILGVPTIITGDKKILLNQRVGKLIIKDKEKVFIPFLKYALNRKQVQKYFSKFSNGGLQINLGKNDLLSYEIELPPLPTQKRIAEILDTADALKRKDQELLTKYDQLAQAIFIDMFGDPVKNEKGWEVKKLDDLLLKGEKISYGVVQPGDDFPNGIPIVRVGDFNLMKVVKTNLKRINPEIEKSYNRTRLIGDEILIACVGSVGKIALADESLKGFNIVRATAKVRVDENIVNRKYLAFHLSQKSIQNYFVAETRTSSQPTLNIKQIEETKILIPPIKLQNQFNLISDDLLKQVEMIHNSKSYTLFSSLIQQAFNGTLVS